MRSHYKEIVRQGYDEDHAFPNHALPGVVERLNSLLTGFMVDSATNFEYCVVSTLKGVSHFVSNTSNKTSSRDIHNNW